MKFMSIVLCGSLLLVAGCGDKQEDKTSQTESSTLMDQTADTASSTLEQSAETTSNVMNQAEQGMAEAGDTMADTADAMQDEAAQMAEQTEQTADQTADQIAGTVDEAIDPMASAPGEDASAAMDMTQQATGEAAQGATSMPDQTTAGVQGTEPPTTTQADAASAAAIAPAAGAPAEDLAQGQSVYDGKCKACHATGASGAPKLGDTANWAPRIEKGMDAMVKNAIEGYKGDVGYMPPKGGFMSLTDEEVKAAVAYMVAQSR